MTIKMLRSQKGTTTGRSSGFTLIELLVVMGVIVFMAGMITYALLGAQTDARVARTRSTIQKLNEVILQQWEEYRYRPVDMRKGSFRFANGMAAPMPPRAQSHLRTVILRDTMRMEMPDRVSDLLFQPSNYVVPPHLFGPSSPYVGAHLSQRAIPHRVGLISEALRAALANSNILGHRNLATTMVLVDIRGFYEASLPPQQPPALLSPPPSAATLVQWNEAVQSSELLYLIIATSNYGGSPALELFRPSDIGDPDNDGLLEFVDAWGRPIQWIRWPAGYPSDLNRYANDDAMDPLKTDWRYDPTSGFSDAEKPQTIVPLIYSGGPDEQPGVVAEFDRNNPIIYARMQQMHGMQNYVDPFFTWDFVNNGANGPSSAPPFPENHPSGFRANQLGSISNESWATDDITNHDLILEP